MRIPETPTSVEQVSRNKRAVREPVWARARRILRSCAASYRSTTFAITLFCLALIGTVWMVTLERASFERAETIAGAVKQTSNLAIAFEEHTVRTLKGIDQVLQFIRHEYLEGHQRPNIQALIEKGAIDHSIFNYVSIVDEHGNLVLASTRFDPINFADREYFGFHQQNNADELLIGKAQVGRITGKWGIPISRRISKPDGSFGGIAYVAVDPDYFTGFYQKADLGERGLVVLLGVDGFTRARRIGQASSYGLDRRPSTMFAEQAKRKSGTFLSAGRWDAIPRYFSYRTLAEYPLIVAVGVSQAETLALFRLRERDYFLGAAFFSVIIGIFGFGLAAALSRQRRTLDALGESEAKFRATFDQAAVGIAHTSLDKRYLMANRKLCEMLGYSHDELLAKRTNEIPHPDDRRDDANMERLLAGEIDTYSGEKRYVRKDGSVLWVNRTISLARDAAGTPLYFIRVVEDIAERKRAEERLRDSEEHFKCLAEMSSDWFWEQDANFRFTAFYGDFVPLAGFRQEDILGKTRWEIPYFGLTEEQIQEHHAVVEAHRPYSNFEFGRMGADGKVRYRSISGEPVHDAQGNFCGYRGVGHDITERKRAEEALKNSNVLLNDMGRIATIGAWEFDAVAPNQGWTEVKQVWTDEVYRIHEVERDYRPTVSKGIGFYAPACRPIIEHAVQQAIAAGEPFDVELEFITAKGNQRRVHAVGRADRERGKVLGTIQDITERKRTERALRESEDRLRQALEERERLSRDLHDDIVQSIYAIGLGLEHVKRLITANAQRAKKSLSELIARLNGVIREVRGHIIGLAPHELDRRQLRAELGALVKMAQATHGIQFNLEIESIALSRLPPNAAYEVINIVREAVSNSLRHSGGKHGVVSLSPNDEGVRLAITDDGAGFDVPELAGRGQGLPNIAARAHELAARLDIVSSPGHGTHIIVDIPAEPMHVDS